MDQNEANKKEKTGILAYLSFAFIFLFFSGIFRGAKAPLSLLDLSTYQGVFGTIVEGAKPGFVGEGGTGLSNLFTTILTIAPPIMFCMGVLEVVEYYGGLRVAGKLLTPILKPLMGVPGEAGVVLITNLQSSDSSAALVKGLEDGRLIDKKQRRILLAFVMAGPALLGMMVSYGVLLYPYLPAGSGMIIVTVLIAKVLTANIVRFSMGRSIGKKNKKADEQEA